PLGITMAVAGSVRQRLDQLFQQRIVIFDGSMGVMLQHKGLSDEEFRGERFRNHPKPLRNNSDVLCLTQPNLVTQVHREYLEAGADIITTNTFTATRVSQADYGLEGFAYEMNLAGARLARKAADAYENRFVAGSLGPTNVTLSLSPKVEDPSYREVTFDQLRDGYAEAASALKEGGVDILLIETVFDTLNAKAAAGCCGTGPEHIRQIREAMAAIPARQVPKLEPRPRFSGLEPFEISPDSGFVVIGERTNVTGSIRFRRLIESGDFAGAVQVALDQVRGGANMLDVNMDADLLDSEAAMVRFLNLIATEPEIARIPVMVDSSKWSVLEAGLKCLQGKGVCNSISLKEGEESFLEKARRVREL